MTIEEVKQIRHSAEMCTEATVPGEHLRALCDLLLETEAKLREVEEERDALLSEMGPAADYWGRACARVLDREKAAWQSRDQAREKLRQAEAERDQSRAALRNLVDAHESVSSRIKLARIHGLVLEARKALGEG